MMIKSKRLRNIFFLLLFNLTNGLVSQTTISIIADNSNSKDAWIWSLPKADTLNFGEQNNYNGGLNNVIRAESWKWFGRVQSDTIRSLIFFDLSSIPKNASIIEAKLSLYFFSNPGFTPQLGENSFTIKRILENWSESKVNWINQPATTKTNYIIVPKSESLQQNFLNIDIRNFVQEWVYFPKENYGVLISLLKEIEYNGCTFGSSEHPNKSLRPVLNVKYILP